MHSGVLGRLPRLHALPPVLCPLGRDHRRADQQDTEVPGESQGLEDQWRDWALPGDCGLGGEESQRDQRHPGPEPSRRAAEERREPL